jgi:biotin carboxylase
MKKVLLVDTNVSSAPIHDYLMRAGYEVFVCGANPADFLAKVSRNYVNMDYSDIGKTQALVEALAVDYIVPGCNDHSYQVCAELNADGHFPGLDSGRVATEINNKQQFRALASQIGLPVPRVIPDDKAVDVWPVIVKPVDAYSGRGITIVREQSRDALPDAIRQARAYSRTRSCIVEEYVEGQLFSHSAFIAQGMVQSDFVVEEHGTANPFVVDTSRVVYDFPHNMLERLRECVAGLARNLELVDGLVHTQFIRHGDRFWVVEITRRCPGDLYSQLIELSTGFRYAEAYARPFLGLAADMGKQSLVQSRVMRHTLSLPVEGVLEALRFSLPVQIEKLVPLSLAGDVVKASPFGRIGLLFAGARSETEFADLFEATLKRKLYSIH